MKKSFALSLVALLLAQFPTLPASAESCEGDFCEVTFSLTGEILQWQVPAGVSQLNFEIAGGSGGRGGLGGKIHGTLTDLPETLFIAVGGAGKVGSQAAGGFNGGGNAGGFRTNEGSGGGASDIRFGPDLADRVAVAGGGGGAGGFSGAPGGPGGGLVGANGQSGQGSGGLGGSQTSGGTGGNSNGGTLSTAGGFGFGGTGGNSTNAGGGGGGGGWFGGGGGGADDDSCCTDGGGGGGGSSFAIASNTHNVEHLQGAHTGDGFVKLSYEKVQSLIGFTATQNAQTALFTLELLLPQALELDQFDLSQLRCDLVELESAGSTIRLLGSGCENGEQLVALRVDALRQGLPNQDQLVLVNFDALGPEFFWSEARVNHLQGTVVIDYAITETMLTVDNLLVQGCGEVNIGQSNISLADCAADVVEVSIAAGVLSDEFGNTGPAATMSQLIQFDRVLPEVSFANSVADVILGTHQVELLLSEPSALDVSMIQMSGTSECSFLTETISFGYRLSSSCGYGSFSYVVPVGSLVDLVGNLGPTQEARFDFELVEPVPEVLAPEPIPETVQPEPESAPVLSPVSEEPEAQLPVLDNAPVEVVPVLEPEPVQEPEPTLETAVPKAAETELIPALTTQPAESDLVDPIAASAAPEPVITEPSGGEAEPKPDLKIDQAAGSESNVVAVAGPVPLKPEVLPWFLSPWALALVSIALVTLVGLLGYRFSGR